MKILQVNKFFFLKGGSERYFFDLSKRLELDGHDVSFFSMLDERNEATPYAKYFAPAIDFQKNPSLRKSLRFIHSGSAVAQLRRLLAEERPQVAHLHNIAHQLTPSIIRELQRAKVPTVMTLHDYQVICPNYKLYTQGRSCERCKRHNYWNAVRFHCVRNSTLASALSAIEMSLQNELFKNYKRVDRFIAPSQFIRERMIDWGWPEEQLLYLPHFTGVRRDGSVKKKPQVLFIGRLVHEKGAHLLLDVAEQFPQLTFIFAGAGEERARLERMAERRELKNHKFLGFVKPGRVQQLVQEAQAVVVPSLWYENAPLVVYESLALGTPVIAAEHGGLPELITPGKNGFLFRPGDTDGLAKSLKMLLNTGSFDLPVDPFPVKGHVDRLMRLYEEIQP